MSECVWNNFIENCDDINYLNKVIYSKTKKYKYRSMIRMLCAFQLNLLTIKQCVNKNNQGMPSEIWNIIFGYLTSFISKYNPTYYKSLNYETRFTPWINVACYNNGYDLTYHFRHGHRMRQIVNINNLEKMINIGQLCSSGAPLCGHMFYIIVDINIIDKTIACITDEWSDSYMEIGHGGSKVHMGGCNDLLVQTYDEFIGGHDDNYHVHAYQIFYPEIIDFAKNKYLYLMEESDDE